MADNYYDATGVLMLDKVTPVITALFGAFDLDETYPGNGAVYIARISESNDPQWENVFEGLVDLTNKLSLQLPPGDEVTIESYLHLLARQFHAEDNDELENLIEHHSFEDGADLEALFLLARCFDDGHGLKAIRFEGAWHCSKPRLFEFGGDGCFLSREVRLFSTTTQALELAEGLRKAMLADAPKEAASLILQETLDLLSGIQDDKLRAKLQRYVAECLLASSS